MAKSALPPELAHLADSMQKLGKWRDSYLPNGEVWVTEFGWDTFAKGSEHSKVYAGEQNQANWILRGLVTYRAAEQIKPLSSFIMMTKLAAPKLI